MNLPNSSGQLVRTIQWHDGTSTQDVQIFIWPAVQVGSSGGPNAGPPIQFECRFKIAGLPHDIEAKGVHIDALGAMVHAIDAIRTLLRPYVANLSYLGLMSDHGIPGIAPWFDDSQENRYLEQLIETEANRYMSIAKRPGFPKGHDG